MIAQKKERHILVIINRSSGELEWLMPILYWLGKKEFKVVLLFLKKKEHLYFLNSTYLKRISSDIDMQLFCIEDWWRFGENKSLKRLKATFAFKLEKLFEKLKNFLFKPENNNKYIAFQIKAFFKYVDIRVSYEVLFFDNSFYKDIEKNRYLNSLVLDKFSFEKVIIYPHAPTFVEIANRHPDNKPPNKNTFYWNRYPELAKKTLMVTDDLMKMEQYSKGRGLTCEYVGCPRFQDWWVKTLNSITVSKKNKNKVLILSKLQGRLFKDIPTQPPLALLEDIIVCCEKLRLEWRLKVHPRDNIQKIKDLLSRVSQKQFDDIVCSGSVFDIQNQFDFCISIPNSAMLDTVSANIPTIEYYDYRYKDISGQSHNSQLAKQGVVKQCFDRDELIELISRYTSSKEELKKTSCLQKKAFTKLYDTRLNAGLDVQNLIDNFNI